jgi:hypothetical protein
VVQSAGEGFQLKAQAVKEAFNRCAAVRDLLLRYTQALITQMAQTAVCNRHHSVDEQLCRLLLLCLDRMRGKELVMTQESLAHMLGVRREGVTGSAGRLQKAGLISCTRGHILVLDREGIEKRACECYAVVAKEYDRLLPKAEVKVASGAEGRLPRYAQLSSVVPPWAASLAMKSANLGNKPGAIGRARRIVLPSPDGSSR